MLDFKDFVNNESTEQNVWNNSFQTLDNWQHKNLISKKRLTSELIPNVLESIYILESWAGNVEIKMVLC